VETEYGALADFGLLEGTHFTAKFNSVVCRGEVKNQGLFEKIRRIRVGIFRLNFGVKESQIAVMFETVKWIINQYLVRRIDAGLPARNSEVGTPTTDDRVN